MNDFRAFRVGQTVRLKNLNHIIESTDAAKFLEQKGILLEQNDFFCYIEFPDAKEVAPYNTLWVPTAYVEAVSL